MNKPDLLERDIFPGLRSDERHAGSDLRLNGVTASHPKVTLEQPVVAEDPAPTGSPTLYPANAAHVRV